MKEHSQIEALSGRVYARMKAAQLQRGAAHGSDDAGAAQASPTPLIGNRYVPGRRIGSGRLGEIYEAADQASGDLGLSRRIAVQLIEEKVGAHPRTADDLARAYSALRAGSHPNVVKIVDFGRQGRALYLVMELLDGVSLRSVLDDSGPDGLELEEIKSTVLAVGQALEYLHAKGLVYGELRPENVFVTFDYQIKLLDVAPVDLPGCAPYYVEDADAPAGRERDTRDDVYGLACLTYELLCGRHPFNANSPVEAHRAGLQPRPLPGLTARDWGAISQGMQLLRAERVSTVGQYLEALGLTGNERLRAELREDPRPVAAVPQRPVRAAQAAVRPARAQGPESTPPESSARTGTVRMMIALAFVASIGALALVYYAELRDATSDTLTVIDGRPNQVSSPGRQSAVKTTQPVSTTQPASTNAAGTPAAQPVDSVVASGRVPDAQPAADPSTSTEAAAVLKSVSAPPVAGAPLVSSSVAAMPATSGGAATPSAAPQFVFDAPVVTVSERMSAVSIVIRRTGDVSLPASAVWWASDDTAKADEDYADLGLRIERFAAGEDNRAVLIPLISDSVPERTESFFVYVGRGEASRSHVDVLSSVRVDIVDDD